MKKILFFWVAALLSVPTYAASNPVIDYAHLPFTLLSFFGMGILLAFTPCLLPMIPILSGILVGQEKISTLRALKLSLVFVLGMSVTYAIAGVVAGYIGSTIQSAMQTPWVIISFSLIFVIMALSMFGVFDLRMPKFILKRAQYLSNQQKSSTLCGVAGMGMLSTLIASPCVTAPMLSVLTYIGQTGNALLGGLTLFTLSLGMGLPLILFGVGQGTLLPKAGNWMNKVKQLFGVVMLGLAIWMMSRLLPGNITMLLWAALIIISAISFGALDFRSEKKESRLLQGFSFLALIYGVMLSIGASYGNDNFLRPLQSRTSAHNVIQPVNQLFTTVANFTELEQKLLQAKFSHKPVMIEFYAGWCPDCRALDKSAFSTLEIQQLMQAFEVVRVDITHDNQELKDLRDRYHIYGVPSVVFYDNKGQQIAADYSQEITRDVLEQKLRKLI